MKRIISILVIAFFISSDLQAQVSDNTKTVAKETKTKYYYYPDANVYYNDATKNYSYYDEASKTWMTNTTLPGSFTITTTTEKIPIFYSGSSIWSDNAIHQKKYRKPTKKP